MQVVVNVVAGVATIGGSLYCYIFANQQSWDPRASFKLLPQFFSTFFLSHRDTFSFLCKLLLQCEVKKKKKQKKTKFTFVGYSVTLATIVGLIGVIVVGCRVIVYYVVVHPNC
jgi:hypothetical protein